jgi:osmotically-inducible protein OsmY
MRNHRQDRPQEFDSNNQDYRGQGGRFGQQGRRSHSMDEDRYQSSNQDYGYGSTQESRDFRNQREDRYQGALDFGSHEFHPQQPSPGFQNSYNSQDYQGSRGSQNWSPSQNEGSYDSGNRGFQTGNRNQDWQSRQDWQSGSMNDRGGASYGSYGQDREFSAGRFTGKGPKGYKRSDERIKEDVSELIMRHPEIDGSDIEIEVASGEVTLTGNVPERRMKHLLEDLIERTLGVGEIHNQLKVKKADSSEMSSSSADNDRASGKGVKKSASGSNPGH